MRFNTRFRVCENIQCETSPEQMLWAAVAERALIDYEAMQDDRQLTGDPWVADTRRVRYETGTIGGRGCHPYAYRQAYNDVKRWIYEDEPPHVIGTLSFIAEILGDSESFIQTVRKVARAIEERSTSLVNKNRVRF